MRSFVVEPGFNGTAISSTATVSIPVGNVTYHKLQLLYQRTSGAGATQAQIEADITEIRVLVNGKIQRRFSAKTLDAINAFMKRPFQGTGFPLEIFLGEPWMRSPQAEDALAWGTGDASTFQLQVDIAGTAVTPTLALHAEVDYISQSMGAIMKWSSYTQPVSAIGHTINNTIPKIDAISAIHAFPVANTDITDVTVTVDNVIRLQGSETDLNTLYANEAVQWVPQANVFSVFFNRTGRAGDVLPMVYKSGGKVAGVVQDLRVDWDMAAANSFPFTLVTLGPRN
jgi:hypothetical protein